MALMNKLFDLNSKLYSPHSLFGINASGFQSGGWDWNDNFTSYTSDANFAVTYPTDDSTEMKGRAATDDILISMDGSVASNHNLLYRDFGTTIDDTAWVLRQPIDFTTVTETSTPYSISMYYGFGSNLNKGFGAAQDFLGLAVYLRTGGFSKYYTTYTDGTSLGDALGTVSVDAFTRTPSVEKIWNEQIRTSATQLTNEHFSDAYVTSLEKLTTTILSTTISLRYWKCLGTDNALNGQLTSTIDASLQFANGVTVAP